MVNGYIFDHNIEGDLENKVIKLINTSSENLKKMASKIDTTKMKNPSFLMVLTATGKYSYKREDGVYVVPIGCLKN